MALVIIVKCKTALFILKVSVHSSDVLGQCTQCTGGCLRCASDSPSYSTILLFC